MLFECFYARVLDKCDKFEIASSAPFKFLETSTGILPFTGCYTTIFVVPSVGKRGFYAIDIFSAGNSNFPRV